MMPRRLASLAAAIIVAFVTLACGDGGHVGSTPPAGRAVAPSGKITVFAAASLTDSFAEMKGEFRKKYRGTDIEFQFGGSPTLRTQLDALDAKLRDRKPATSSPSPSPQDKW